MKTHGILMSGEMIRAYKAGLKSQTRRTRGLDEVNEKPDDWIFEGLIEDLALFSSKDIYSNLQYGIKPPYGVYKDMLWFKETHALICKDYPCDDCNGYVDHDDEVYNTLKYHDLEYRADTKNKRPGEWPEDEAKGNSEAPKWIPSIFMKKVYSRFVDISILSVRVERLKDISEADAKAEGVICPPPKSFIHSASYREEYMNLWDKLNGHKLPVEFNPWVWVYEFQKFGGG